METCMTLADAFVIPLDTIMSHLMDNAIDAIFYA